MDICMQKDEVGAPLTPYTNLTVAPTVPRVADWPPALHSGLSQPLHSFNNICPAPTRCQALCWGCVLMQSISLISDQLPLAQSHPKGHPCSHPWLLFPKVPNFPTLNLSRNSCSSATSSMKPSLTLPTLPSSLFTSLIAPTSSHESVHTHPSPPGGSGPPEHGEHPTGLFLCLTHSGGSTATCLRNK